jgi:hypothetical protein
MSAPDHAENTGDNLRHAAEVQEQAKEGDDLAATPAEQSVEKLPPDFNT